MAVYVDGARNKFHKALMCHMVADTPEELHAMAASIGMERRWYQGPVQASFPHYDVSMSGKMLARARGAQEIGRLELSIFMKRIRRELVESGNTWRTAGWWE